MHHAPDEWAGGSIVIQASDENAFTKPEVYMDRQNVYACKWRLQIRSPDFLVCSQSCPGTLLIGRIRKLKSILCGTQNQFKKAQSWP